MAASPENGRRRTIALILAATIGAGVGIGIDRWMGRTPVKDGPETAGAPAVAGAKPIPAPADEDAVGKVRAILQNAAMHPHRARTTVELGAAIGNVPLSDFPPVATLLSEHAEGAASENALFGVLLLYARWAEADLHAALAGAEAHAASSALFRSACQGILSVWVERDARAAMEHVEGLSRPGDARHLKTLALGMLTRSQPEVAAAMAISESVAAARSQHLQAVVSVWAESDAAAAIDWVRKLEDVNQRRSLLPGTIQAWTRHAPEEALAYARGIEEAAMRKAAINSALSAWAGRDAEAAVDYMLKIPTDERPAMMLQSMTWAIGRVPLAKIAVIVEQLPDGADRNQFVSRVVAGQAWHDPQGAADLASVLPESAGRNRSFNTVAAAWARKDAREASEWLAELPESSSRDAAVASFVRVLMDSDPESAVVWAESISDDSQRRRTLFPLALRWKEVDRQTAEAWIAATPLLTAGDKEALGKQ